VEKGEVGCAVRLLQGRNRKTVNIPHYSQAVPTVICGKGKLDVR